MPAPECFQAYFFSCDEDDGLGPIIDALRPLRLEGTIKSASHIANDYKVLSALRQYPWEETGGQTPLSPELMRQFAKKLNIGRWNGSGALYGTRVQVAEARRLLKKALKGRTNRLQFLDDRTLSLAAKFAKPCSWITGWDLSRILDLVRPVYGLMKGIPTDHPIESVYWRKRFPAPKNGNPDRDGCGLLWWAPMAPAQGHHAMKVMDIASTTLFHGGFEPIVSITLLTERTVCLVVSITYDRDVPGEDDRALACHSVLSKRLSEGGYLPYRLGVQGMSQMNAGSAGYRDLLKILKQTVDPNSVLSPGRYEPSQL
jgi:4-cresol dehydrogenase (hydroxylating)